MTGTFFIVYYDGKIDIWEYKDGYKPTEQIIVDKKFNTFEDAYDYLGRDDDKIEKISIFLVNGAKIYSEKVVVYALRNILRDDYED